ncbi:hypothetical protein [uncultured Thalassolituus sp.]|uniref:hypothetical protein n=1 Tax=uncultured Thalassolituus sp. TaxID=285273 RepID=UPI00262A5307|nr:hypothetical protein [uncultured Thalassolituus sp.]
MDIPESIKKTLNESNLTNPSKLYTPFTLFVVFFSIYFKAETLGQIFLSNDWKTIELALKSLYDPGPWRWFAFAVKVISYSLGMLALYGLAQVAAVLIWSTSNWLHIRIAAIFEKLRYKSNKEYEEMESKYIESKEVIRGLHEKLNKFRDWTPQDYAKLEENFEALTNINEKLKKDSNNESERSKQLQRSFDDLTQKSKTKIAKLESEIERLSGFENNEEFINALIERVHQIRNGNSYIDSHKVIELIEGILQQENEFHVIPLSEDYKACGQLSAILTSIDSVKVCMTDNGLAMDVNTNKNTINYLRHYLEK